MLDSMIVVKEFLADKDGEYVKLFNWSIYEKICCYITLAVYYRDSVTHQLMCQKAIDFAKEYPYLTGGIKQKILFAIKSNYRLYCLFLSWVYRNEKVA